MGFVDVKWGGFAKIIVDTATMQVGDKVRVKSMTTGTTYDKTVATVGTPLVWETEIYKDYVKICMVQTINDTPTEIGGVYREVDFGKTLYVNVLDKTTLGGIQGILNAHQESSLLAIGDEVDITVNGNPWTMQIAGINVYHDHDIMFTSKHIWSLAINSNYTVSDLRQSAQNFYADIDNKDKQYIKEVTRACRQNNGDINYNDYCFVLGNKETANAANYGVVASQVQMSLFVTQSNRVKTYQGSANAYWTSDWCINDNMNAIYTTGALGDSHYTNQYGVVPSFMLIADS